MNKTDSQNIGLTRSISIVYLVFSFGLFLAIFSSAKIGDITLEIKDIWIPIFIAITAFATIRRTKWGRWLSYIFSLFILLGMPIGTLLGGFMIWHLTKYKSSFNNWI